jgi:hypothetical protein
MRMLHIFQVGLGPRYHIQFQLDPVGKVSEFDGVA